MRSAEHRTQIDGVPGSRDSRIEARKQVAKPWSSAMRVPRNGRSEGYPRVKWSGEGDQGTVSSGADMGSQRHEISGWEGPDLKDYEELLLRPWKLGLWCTDMGGGHRNRTGI